MKKTQCQERYPDEQAPHWSPQDRGCLAERAPGPRRETALMQRKGAKEDDQGHRHYSGGADPLRDAEGDQLGHVLGETAGEGEDREYGYRGEEDAAWSEPVGQPAEGQQEHRARDG